MLLAFLIHRAGTGKQPGTGEGRGPAAGLPELVVERRAVGPLVEQVGDAVRGQQREKVRVQKPAIAHLDATTPAPRQAAEKAVEGRHKVAAAGEVLRVEARELEHHQPDGFANRLQRAEKLSAEQFRVEETGIGLARVFAMARQRRVTLHGYVVGDLEGEAEVRRNLADEAAGELLRGEGVVGRVHAHGRQKGGVSFQAMLLEARVRKFASVAVAIS